METLLTKEDTPCEISLNALAGNSSLSTIRLHGFLKRQEIQILVDSGSTHSFISTDLVNKLKLTAQVVSPLLVSVADGNQVVVDTICNGVPYSIQGHQFTSNLRPFNIGGADLILGVDWLKQYNPITFDYQHYHVAINKDGVVVKLQGDMATSTLQIITGKQLSKLLKSGSSISQGCICFLTSTSLAEQKLQKSPVLQPIQQLLTQYHHVFSEPKGMPPVRSHDHKIPLLEGSQPFNQRSYKVPYIQKAEIEKQIKEMLNSGIIQKSTSPYASPIILVKKKDGTWRMCVDYRQLNDRTVKNKYPIPLIDELLDELKGASWFTKLDLRSGYHQIRVAPDDIFKTAFKTHHGLYEFKVMPFGLTNAPATFQALMNEIFEDQLRKNVLVFFDDILIYSDSLHNHLLHLEMVLQKLHNHSLYAKESKCLFGQRQLEYLGHIISSQGVATDPSKVQAMLEWPIPVNIKQLRGFLGLTGYYRRFVQNYGLISRPLTELLKKGSFQWNDRAAVAFTQLKKAMSTTPVLTLPDYTQPFVVEVDACDNGIGAVLMQKGRPLAFLSKGLAPKHQKLSTYEKELLAVVLATQKWRTYLQGHHFIIKTDHQSLKYLLEQKLTTLMQQKWLAKLMGLDYEIVYKKGKENVVADALSRLPTDHSTGKLLQISVVQHSWLSDVLQSYEGDLQAKGILTDLAAQTADARTYQYCKGLIQKEGKIFVGSASNMRRQILWELHDSPHGGHSGQEATFHKVSQFFFWPGLRKDVEEYVKSCDICQRVKTGTTFPGGLLQPLPVPTQIWEDVSLDFIEGLPKSGDANCILVVIDRFTKVGHFIPLSHPFSATTVAQHFLDNIYKLHGMPKTITSDRDRVFTSQFWRELFRLVGTKLQLSTSYHPQTDGQTERLNRCIEQFLRCMVSHRPKLWGKWLPLAQWWYNTTYNSAIRRSPYEALYGTQPRQICIPAGSKSSVDSVLDWQAKREAMNQLLKESITAAQNKYKQYADSKRTEAVLQVGDMVFLKLQPYRQLSVAVRRYLKLSHKYFGPYKVLEKIGAVAYKLDLPPNSLVHPVFHISLLKRKIGSRHATTTELPKIGAEGQFLVYPVKILERRMVKRNNKALVQWLIQWSHSIPEDASWEDAAMIQEQFPDFSS